MAITVKHSKTSTIPDGSDTDLIRPSDWNADHTLSGLGTMAEQNANNVAITGGSISGVTGVVSSVTGTAPVVSSGGTTPAISMHVADATHDGYLSSTDWSTFNSKGGGDVVGPSSATDNAIARFDLTTGKLIQNSAVIIDDSGNVTGVNSITDPDYITFNTSYATALTAGQLGWDGNNTLGLGMAGGNITQHIGEDQFIYVKASSAITKGQLIMFNGTDGASGHILAIPATGLTVAQYIIGIAAENLSIGGFGLVQTFGQLDGIDTSGSSVGETWANGDVLYYNSSYAGGLTKTFPTSGPIVIVAAIIYAHSGTTGKIIVRPSFTQKISAGTGISVSQTSSGSTITNSAPDQTVALTGTSPITTSGTYPNFTIAITQATTSTNGYLSSTDWNTFNNKQVALVSGTNIKTVNGTTLLGSGDLGTITAAYGGTGLTSPGTSGNVLTSNGSAWVSSAPSSGVTKAQAIAYAMTLGF